MPGTEWKALMHARDRVEGFDAWHGQSGRLWCNAGLQVRDQQSAGGFSPCFCGGSGDVGPQRSWATRCAHSIAKQNSIAFKACIPKNRHSERAGG
eukprot:364051-Chlamydomonas_euryale.AAC.12